MVATRVAMALLTLGLPLGLRAGELCLGIVPGTEPERALEAGALALRFLEDRRVTLVVGTEPLLEIRHARAGDLLEVLQGVFPRPTRGRLVPTLQACMDTAAGAILLITAESHQDGLIPLLAKLGKRGTGISVVALAPGADALLQLAEAGGGTAFTPQGSHDVAIDVLRALSLMMGADCGEPRTLVLDPPNPVLLEGRGALFLVSEVPLEAFVVAQGGRRVEGELIQRGSVFVYRFALPTGRSHLVSTRYATAEALLILPKAGFPWGILVIAPGGALALGASLWLLRRKASAGRNQFPRVALHVPGRPRRVIEVPPEGLTFGRGESSVKIEDPTLPDRPVLELVPVEGGLRAIPSDGAPGLRLNGFPLDAPADLSTLDRLSLGETEIVVLSTGERR